MVNLRFDWVVTSCQMHLNLTVRFFSFQLAPFTSYRNAPTVYFPRLPAVVVRKVKRLLYEKAESRRYTISLSQSPHSYAPLQPGELAGICHLRCRTLVTLPVGESNKQGPACQRVLRTLHIIVPHFIPFFNTFYAFGFQTLFLCLDCGQSHYWAMGFRLLDLQPLHEPAVLLRR